MPRYTSDDVDFVNECLTYNAIEGCMLSGREVKEYCEECSRPDESHDFSRRQRTLFARYSCDARLCVYLSRAATHWGQYGDNPIAARYLQRAQSRMV